MATKYEDGHDLKLTNKRYGDPGIIDVASFEQQPFPVTVMDTLATLLWHCKKGDLRKFFSRAIPKFDLRGSHKDGWIDNILISRDKSRVRVASRPPRSLTWNIILDFEISVQGNWSLIRGTDDDCTRWTSEILRVPPWLAKPRSYVWSMPVLETMGFDPAPDLPPLVGQLDESNNTQAKNINTTRAKAAELPTQSQDPLPSKKPVAAGLNKRRAGPVTTTAQSKRAKVTAAPHASDPATAIRAAAGIGIPKQLHRSDSAASKSLTNQREPQDQEVSKKIVPVPITPPNRMIDEDVSIYTADLPVPYRASSERSVKRESVSQPPVGDIFEAPAMQIAKSEIKSTLLYPAHSVAEPEVSDIEEASESLFTTPEMQRRGASPTPTFADSVRQKFASRKTERSAPLVAHIGHEEGYLLGSTDNPRAKRIDASTHLNDAAEVSTISLNITFHNLPHIEGLEAIRPRFARAPSAPPFASQLTRPTYMEPDILNWPRHMPNVSQRTTEAHAAELLEPKDEITHVDGLSGATRDEEEVIDKEEVVDKDNVVDKEDVMDDTEAEQEASLNEAEEATGMMSTRLIEELVVDELD